MANKIQLRRDTAANWERVNPILDDGEPGLDITANQVKYGDGSTAWNDLPAAGGGLAAIDGLVSFPGDLLIGTLWPEDPMPEGDKESVIWAKDDTEYLGLWWGGDQTYPEDGYGPVAGIMIGAYDDMTDDFSEDPSPADTNITIGINDSMGFTNEWRFDRDGNITFPQGTLLGYSDPGGFIIDGAVDKDIAIYTYSGDDAHGWTFGTDGNLTLPPSGDILIDGGTNSAIRDILQNDVHTGAANYTLVLSDRGKMIYQTGGYSVIVPAADGSTITFPVGTVITVVNSGGAGDLFIDAADAGANTDIYGAGTDTNSDTWALPSNSIASLMKVEASGAYSKWLLSGAGIYDNS